MNRVNLTFLGSGDAFGSGGRFQTCLYLNGSNESVLIDCGASSLIAMKRQGINPSHIGCVLLSHLHGDHFGGVPFLILDGQFSKRTLPLVIAGPSGLGTRIEAAMEAFFPGSSNIRRNFPVQFIALADHQRSRIGNCTVIPFEVRHPSGSPSYALRVEYGGKVISYSGDTEWVDGLLDVARGADVFVCEAYFFEKKVKYHLDYATLRERRSDLGCARLILTHMGPDMLDHLGEAECETAGDGATFLI